MNNVGQKFLPIGTVVMLKEGSKRVMITGFCSMAADDQNIMYDYAGCMYPEGVLSSDETALFNHEQIQTVYHLGLIDDEEKQFKASLNNLVAQMTGEKVETSPTSANGQPHVATNNNSVDIEAVPPIGPGLPGYTAPVQQHSQSAVPVNGPIVPNQSAQQASTAPAPSVTDIQF